MSSRILEREPRAAYANSARCRNCIALPMPSVNERQALLLPRARDGACHAHHSLPLYRRPLGNLLKVQASALGMASGSVAVLVGLLILATFLAVFNYLTPSGKLTVTGRRAGGDAECVGSDHPFPSNPTCWSKPATCCFRSILHHSRTRYISRA